VKIINISIFVTCEIEDWTFFHVSLSPHTQARTLDSQKYKKIIRKNVSYKA
jgi:hypothetical protein